MNRAEDISKESIVVRAAAAFSGKGNVLRKVFEDIQSNMASNSHILRRMIFTDAAAVFVEGHVQTPLCVPTGTWRFNRISAFYE